MQKRTEGGLLLAFQAPSTRESANRTRKIAIALPALLHAHPADWLPRFRAVRRAVVETQPETREQEVHGGRGLNAGNILVPRESSWRGVRKIFFPRGERIWKAEEIKMHDLVELACEGSAQRCSSTAVLGYGRVP